MKRFTSRIVCGIFILILFSLTAVAQELKNVNPKMNHDLADNKILHAAEVTLQPGEKTDMHTHPAHFFYALSEGKLMVHYKDGKDELYEMKPGDSGYS